MRHDDNAHLDPQRITMSLVDDNDLAPHERDHLGRCPECGEARKRLAGQLNSLSEKAARFTPVSQLKVRLSASEAVPWSGWTIKRYGGLATAAACIVIIIMLSWSHLFHGNLRPYGGVNLAAETAADARLMAATKDLSENSLPVSLREIVPDPGPADDEDLLDFVVPLDDGYKSNT